MNDAERERRRLVEELRRGRRRRHREQFFFGLFWISVLVLLICGLLAVAGRDAP